MSKCPECGGKTRTLDNRPTKNGDVWRRRECNSCKFRYTTFEILGGPHSRSLEIVEWASESNRDIFLKTKGLADVTDEISSQSRRNAPQSSK